VRQLNDQFPGGFQIGIAGGDERDEASAVPAS